MSLYDKTKEEVGTEPAYPHRTNYKSVYGYAAGKSLGLYASKEAARAAGAKTFEDHFDDVNFSIDMEAYRAYNTKLTAEWKRRLRLDYPELSDDVFEIVFDKAWEMGHSNGHAEVENTMVDLAELAVKIKDAK